MRTKGTTRALPGELRRLRERFDAWRRTRDRRRIPERLWSDAARAAGRYGVSRTARALRLNAQALRERIPAPASGDRATFVEVAAVPLSGDRAGYVLEVESAGARLRLDVRGPGDLDLVALIRSVVGGAP